MSALVALDGQTNTMWMFGGYRGFEINELWSLDLTTLRWTQHSVGLPAPLARNGAPAFFDSVSRSMVFFGGLSHNTGQNLNDLWAYSVDTHTWRQLVTSGELPGPRHGHLGVFAPALNRFVIFGGRDYPAALVFGDAFVLNLTGCAASKGDMNGDQRLTAADVVLMLNCVSLEQGSCDLCFADVSCNGFLTSLDVVILLNAVFLEDPIDCSL